MMDGAAMKHIENRKRTKLKHVIKQAPVTKKKPQVDSLTHTHKSNTQAAQQQHVKKVT
jgi:hypothetical protein